MSNIFDLDALDAYIDARVEEAVANRLGAVTPEADPWLGSKAAAEYMGISLSRVHDLVWSGKLTRHGEKGDRLAFRRSELDASMERRIP